MMKNEDYEMKEKIQEKIPLQFHHLPPLQSLQAQGRGDT